MLRVSPLIENPILILLPDNSILQLDRGRVATSAENLLLEMRWREIDVRILNNSFLKTFAVAVPDLPQLSPRRNSQRTRIILIFFN